MLQRRRTGLYLACLAHGRQTACPSLLYLCCRRNCRGDIGGAITPRPLRGRGARARSAAHRGESGVVSAPDASPLSPPCRVAYRRPRLGRPEGTGCVQGAECTNPEDNPPPPRHIRGEGKECARRLPPTDSRHRRALEAKDTAELATPARVKQMVSAAVAAPAPPPPDCFCFLSRACRSVVTGAAGGLDPSAVAGGAEGGEERGRWCCVSLTVGCGRGGGGGNWAGDN